MSVPAQRAHDAPSRATIGVALAPVSAHDISLSDDVVTKDGHRGRRSDRCGSGREPDEVDQDPVELIIRPLYRATLELSGVLSDPGLHTGPGIIENVIRDIDAAIIQLRALLGASSQLDGSEVVDGASPPQPSVEGEES